MDVVIITPEPGRHKDIGQQLLALADNPRDVQWVTWPTAGYSVPLELFSRFQDGTGSEAAEEETPKRRRGRPRKEESTDDTTTSPEEE